MNLLLAGLTLILAIASGASLRQYESTHIAGVASVYVAYPYHGAPAADIREFSAVRQGRNVLLQWTSLRETGIQEYEIQRASSESRGWRRAGGVAGVNGANPHRYSYIDRNVPAEDVRYMLRVHGFSGEFLYSNIIAAPLQSPVRSFDINPANNAGQRKHSIVSMVLTEKVSVTLLLVDRSGRTLTRLLESTELPVGVHTFPVDYSALTPGMYYIRLLTPEGDFHRILQVEK